MSTHRDDVVKVASGTLVEVEYWREALEAAGIAAHLVGADLAAGLGSALAGSVELWVRTVDQDRAVAAIRLAESSPEKPRGQPHPHPASEKLPETPAHHLKKMSPNS